MSARTDFKNALQALTTTLVKAEAARGTDDAALAALRDASREERKRVQAAHAILSVEFDDPRVPHENWYRQTLVRAEAVFGPLPAGE
jgi:hypothetical protein